MWGSRKPKPRITRDEFLQHIQASNPSITKPVVIDSVDLSGIDLSDLSLFALELTNCNLSNAIFDRLTLKCAFITKSDLTGSSLRNTNCFLVHFREVKAVGVNAFGAMLQGVELFSSDWSNASLVNARLIASTNPPEKCELDYSVFSGTDFRGADLSGVKSYHDARFSNAIYNRQTVLPSNFDPQKAGMRYQV